MRAPRRRRAVHRRSRPGGRVGRARGTRSLRRALRGTRAHAPPRPARSRGRELDGAGSRPRSLPGRRRPDPRGGDRIGALPLPPRRREDPPPRRPALLQASRPGARGGGRQPRGRHPLRHPGLRGVRRHERRRLCPRGGGRDRSTFDRRPRARANDPPRARAGLEPPERHLGGVRRDGPGRRLPAVRRPDGARATSERATHRPPLHVRRDPRRGERGESRRQCDLVRASRTRRSPGGGGVGLARAPLQSVVRRPARRRRNRACEGRAPPRCDGSRSPCRGSLRRRTNDERAARIRRIRPESSRAVPWAT